MNVRINTPQDAKVVGQNFVDRAQEQANTKKDTLRKAIENLSKVNPELGGFDEIAALLVLPDEQFVLVAPAFLDSVERSFNNVNDQLAMANALNVAGIRAEDVREEYVKVCGEIDTQMADSLSAPKREFLKQVLGFSYNAVSEAEGVAKRHILIPIEFCRPDAKMPTYAHLTDAGMDIYLTEDVTIHPGETKLIPTGLKCALPLGYELQVRPKSGRSLKSKLRVANTPGTIDAGYRDEIGIIVDNIDPVIRSAEMDETGRLYNVVWGSDITLSKGEKIAQLVLSEVPKAVFYEVDDILTIKNDGRKGGFGSTGDR